MSEQYNRITHALQTSDEKLLSVFYTAGFPRREDTLFLAESLERAGVGMLEIGFPFSDPLADGPTIQASSEQALRNGMTLSLLFKQLEDLRPRIQIPVLLMGYLNPVMQMGVECFCQKCAETGVDGVILPDLPLELYLEKYQEIFERHAIRTTWLITPRTSEERIRMIDAHSSGFIYVVSSFAVTGNHLDVDQKKQEYFQRIYAMNLQNPLVVGFGIHDYQSFQQSTAYADGGIIGSAFVKAIQRADVRQLEDVVQRFVTSIRTDQPFPSQDSLIALPQHG